MEWTTRIWFSWLVIALLLGSPLAGLLVATDVSTSELGRDLGPLGSSLTVSNSVAFARVDALTLASGENRPVSVVIDPLNGFAYIGTFGPGVIVKVDLGTFERVGAFTLEEGEDYLPVAVIDPANGFAYFGTSLPIGEVASEPARIVKVDLATFERVGALTLEAGEDRVGSAVIDPANGFAYFGTLTSPGRVIKVDLATFERVGAFTLEAGEDWLWSAIIDPGAGFAYFGTDTSPGRIVKVGLDPFGRTGAISLAPGENILTSAVIDAANGFAYFGTGELGVPGRVVKVDLTVFERVGAVTLASGENTRRPAVIDPANGFAYFGTLGSPARVVKVGLDPFERVDAITMASGENNLFAAAIDLANGLAYFVTDTSPGRVVRILVGPDTIPPVLTVPQAIVEEATGPDGAVVAFDVAATDIVDPSPSVICSPLSESTFPLGPTTVTCTAADSAGNTAVASFTVTVQDTTPPTLGLPSPIVEEATGPDGVVVTYTSTATDLVDGPLTPTCTPPSGSLFPVGTTTVTCTATDSEGNPATGSFTVTVTAPPPEGIPPLVLAVGLAVAAVGAVAVVFYFLRRKKA